MGQYYKAVVGTPDECDIFDPHNFDNMSKLMEHSYIGNKFADSISGMIFENPRPVIWMGDYADELALSETQKRCYEKAWDADENEDKVSDLRNLYPAINVRNLYFCNHDRKEYVDMHRYIQLASFDQGWCIHPLPLLCALGNGQAGGDYWGIYPNLVGRWNGQSVSFEKEPCSDFTEIFPVFIESQSVPDFTHQYAILCPDQDTDRMAAAYAVCEKAKPENKDKPAIQLKMADLNHTMPYYNHDSLIEALEAMPKTIQIKTPEGRIPLVDSVSCSEDGSTITLHYNSGVNLSSKEAA